MKDIHARAINLKTKWLSNREIARQLWCSVGSVSNRTRYIYLWKKKLVNLCPHPIYIKREWIWEVVKIQESWFVYRVDIIRLEKWAIDGVPVYSTILRNKKNQPPRKKWTIYIVSSICCRAHPEREDFYCVINEEERCWICLNPHWIKPRRMRENKCSRQKDIL